LGSGHFFLRENTGWWNRGKHLPDPFYLEGIERRSLRDAIFREVASNMLIHREYASGVPARFIIERGEVTTFNANRPHGFGALDPETFAPYPKNPVLGLLKSVLLNKLFALLLLDNTG